MRSLEFGAFVFAYFVDRFDCTADFVFACSDDGFDCDGDFVCAFFFSRSGFVSLAFISIVSNANMFLSLCQCFAFQHADNRLSIIPTHSPSAFINRFFFKFSFIIHLICLLSFCCKPLFLLQNIQYLFFIGCNGVFRKGSSF